jgi:low affinity Fe/Cu permease
MFNFDKQKDKWNQILRERKYRPSFFGLSAHFDWKIILLFTIMTLILITFFGFSMQRKIDYVIEKDYSTDVNVRGADSVKIEFFEKKLEKAEK